MKQRLRLAFLFVMAGLVVAAPSVYAKSSSYTPKELWVVSGDKLSKPEQVMALTLQGLTAKDQQRKIWFRSAGAGQILLDQMKQDGASIHDVNSAWDLLREFKSAVKGAIVYKLGTESIDAATSLCGPRQCVAIDESILDKAKSEGLSVIEDVREMTDRMLFEKYGKLFKPGVVVSIGKDVTGSLRDFGVARHAIMIGNTDYELITRVVKTYGPQPLVFGWGNEEAWVRCISSANGTTVPADWAGNLSVLETLPAKKIKRPVEPRVKLEDNVRYIAFVISDGDNVQFLLNRFLWDKRYWSSPLRGKFPVTWEVPCTAAELAPRALEYVYATATPNDGIVGGAGSPGYTYAYLHPNKAEVAKQGAKYLKMADLTVSSVINDNRGALEDYIPLLEQRQVKALMYKPFYPYDGAKGRIIWRDGKPLLSFKFMTWPQRQNMQDLAKKVAAMPTAPKTDQDSFALVSVCAWHHEEIGGPLEYIRRLIEMLPKDTRVVTADQMVDFMRESLRMKTE